MEDSTSPDELLALVLETDRSKDDLVKVYDCMRRYPLPNHSLVDFDNMDSIRNHVVVSYDSASKMHYLVYKDTADDEATRTEAVFEVAGYIASFNLPGCITSQRTLFRPHSLRQSVMITAIDSPDFKVAVQALDCLTAYLNQYATGGLARDTPSRTAYGLPAIEAQTPLFYHRKAKSGYKELTIPHYMDPYGKLMAEVRKKSFCYTEDNAVHYAETSSAADNRMTGNFLNEEFAAESGVFRHGQLVMMSVFIRSKPRRPDPKFPAFTRSIEIGLRSLTLVGREAEIALMKLRLEEQRQKEAELTSIPKTVAVPRRRTLRPLETKEEYVRGKMAKMVVDENSSKNRKEA